MAEATDTQIDIGEILRGIQDQIDLIDDHTGPTDAIIGDRSGEELRELRRTTRDLIDTKFPQAE